MKRPFRIACLFVSATALCLSARAAQDPAPAAQSEEEQQEEESLPSYSETVVVTAAGTEQRISEAPGLVTPFDRSALDGSPALAIDEQLRRVPGFTLEQQGMHGCPGQDSDAMFVSHLRHGE